MLLALPVLLISCSDDNNDPSHITETQSLSGSREMFTVSVVNNVNVSAISTPDYSVDFHVDDNTADVKITGLRLAENETAQSLILKDLRWGKGRDGKSRVIEAARVKPDNSDLTLTDLRIVFYDPEQINGQTLKGASVEFDVNGIYEVNAIPYTSVLSGTSITTNATAGTTFQSTKTVYTFSIDPQTRKADIIVTGASFAANMPSLGDMHFDDVDVTFTDSGYSLYCAALTPSISGTPYPNYAITNLMGDVDPDDNETDFQFNCMRVFTVKAELNGSYYLEK